MDDKVIFKYSHNVISFKPEFYKNRFLCRQISFEQLVYHQSAKFTVQFELK